MPNTHSDSIPFLREFPPDLHRRQALSHLGRLALLCGVALFEGLASAPARALAGRVDTLPRPASWQALLSESGATSRPAIVLFSIEGCGFCKQVRRDHLRYLARPPESNRVIVAELDISDRESFTEGSSPAELAASLNIRVAPTVAFFGPAGELAERLVGYNSADFYGAYLENRIAAASAAISRSADPRTAKGR